MHDSSWSLFNGGKSLLKFNCLSCFSHSLFFTGFYELLWTTDWKGACALEEGWGYVLWPSKQATQLFNVNRKGSTPLSTKIILFSYEEKIYCLCFFSAFTTSLHVSLTSMQSRGMRKDSQNSGGEGREGDLNFPCTRHDCAHRVEVQVPSFATAWPTSSFVSLVKTSFIHGASLLICQYLQDLLHYLTGYNWCRGELGQTHLNISLCSYFCSSIIECPYPCMVTRILSATRCLILASYLQICWNPLHYVLLYCFCETWAWLQLGFLYFLFLKLVS